MDNGLRQKAKNEQIREKESRFKIEKKRKEIEREWIEEIGRERDRQIKIFRQIDKERDRENRSYRQIVKDMQIDRV